MPASVTVATTPGVLATPQVPLTSVSVVTKPRILAAPRLPSASVTIATTPGVLAAPRLPSASVTIATTSGVLAAPCLSSASVTVATTPGVLATGLSDRRDPSRRVGCPSAPLRLRDCFFVPSPLPQNPEDPSGLSHLPPAVGHAFLLEVPLL